MLIVGLSGGIASGKSTVSNLLKEHGLPVIDLDILARQAVEPNTPAFKKLSSHFGPSIINDDGTLNRDRLGEIVFNNEKERKVLNGIVHPAVRKLLVWEVVRCWFKGEKICIVDAPLLVEAGLWIWCGKIILVYCSEQLQLHRLSIRNSLPTSSALARIKSQKPLSSKMVYADYVIDNSGTLTDLKEQVIRTVRKLKSESGGWGWWMSWVFPPWGLFFGMATVVWRLTWKGVGREKKRRVTSSKKRDEIAEGRVNAREEVELRQLRRPEVFEPDE